MRTGLRQAEATMIARIWSGWTIPGNADAYQQIISQEVLPGIADRSLDGDHGAYLLRPTTRRCCDRQKRTPR